MKSLIQLSAKQLVKAILSKKVSSVEVVKAHLDQINKVNPKINAIVQLDAENAIKQAKRADQALHKGKILGKLHGLPITIKDTCEVKDFICTTGTLGYAAYKASKDATVVSRLKNAGAIILGLTNMAELGAAFETDNLVYGRTNNPFDLTRTPGGSSGGEAAIIAACGSPLGLGADGGGSVRVPAHFCGIAGIKPTQGKVPLTGLIVPKDGMGLVDRIGTFGPMARYVEDLILTLPIISGSDEFDSNVVPFPLDSKPKKTSLRIVFYADNGVAKPTPETILTIKQAAKALAKLGHTVEEARPSGLEATYKLLWGVFFENGDGGKGLINLLNNIGSYEISPVLKRFLDSAKKNKLTTTELLGLLGEVDSYRSRLHKFFTNYDIIICPACATPAKKHHTTYDSILDFTYTMTYNLTGWPSTVVRCGTAFDGLPIGVQVIAKPWQDNLSLSVALQLEKILGGYRECCQSDGKVGLVSAEFFGARHG